MTTFSSGEYNQYSQQPVLTEPRTSIMAILSLVLGLLGLCIPGFGLLGLLFGIVALILIGSSNGALAGRGLSAAGIVLGLLFSVIWGALIFGALSFASLFNQSIVAPTTRTMQAIEARDWTAARSSLQGSTAEKVTDADFEAFREAYQKELGAFKSTPTGLWEFMIQLGEMGETMSRFQNNPNNLIPIPVTFEKGKAVVAMQVDPQQPASTGSSGSMPELPIANLQIMFRDGTVVTLYDPENRPLPPGDAATPQPTNQTTDRPTDQPADKPADGGEKPAPPPAPKF